MKTEDVKKQIEELKNQYVSARISKMNEQEFHGWMMHRIEAMKNDIEFYHKLHGYNVEVRVELNYKK